MTFLVGWERVTFRALELPRRLRHLRPRWLLHLPQLPRRLVLRRLPDEFRRRRLACSRLVELSLATSRPAKPSLSRLRIWGFDMHSHLNGFFDELEKIGGLLTETLIKNVARNPVKYYAANERMKKGLQRHRETMEALERGTPAGWVPMGMQAE